MTTSSYASNTDLVDAILQLPTGSPLHNLRHQRSKVVAATQGSYDAIFNPVFEGAANTGLTLAERFLAARTVAELSGGPLLAAHYAQRLSTLPAPAPSAQLDAILQFSRTLALRPVEGNKAALLKLPSAGLSTPDVIALAQLIAFVTYQVRVVAGLRATRFFSGYSL